MNTINKRWLLKPPQSQITNQLIHDLRIHPVLCHLLALRGVSNYESARSYFRPQLDELHDPFLMKDMQNAMEEIQNARENNKKILVYGDYDVDGTTSVSLVYSFLHKHYPHPIGFYIPNRDREGYGVSKAGIDFAHDHGFELIIALDCGIKAVEMIAYARSLDIRVVVCDHHTPGPILPEANAILNPKQADCPYPYKELSGCGIGFKLISALAKYWKLPKQEVFQYLDLVATSIAADIVPMDGENRILAFYGLKKANENPCPSLRIMKDLIGMERPLSISDLVFAIAPRINAAGRMGDANLVVEMLTETDPEKVRLLVKKLQSENATRREVDKNITEEALRILDADQQFVRKKTTVLYKEGWHKGVVGIVASRLMDKFYRPTIILTRTNGKVSGSARSVKGFNVYKALHQCRDLLDSYGGHFYAAGMVMAPEQVPEFTKRFEEVVAEQILPDMLIPQIEVDAEVQFSDLTPSFYHILQQFEPFGPQNMRPVFLSRNLHDYNGYCRFVKDDHIRFTVQDQNGKVMEGIGFYLAEKWPVVQKGSFDMVYSIEECEFNNRKSLQLKVLDIRPSTIAHPTSDDRRSKFLNQT